MKKIGVKRGTLENIALAAQHAFPMEFIALLGSRSRDNIVDEIVVVPAVFGSEHAMLYSSLIPFDSGIIGSVHSHPSEYNFPSKADLDSFRKLGKVHLIISRPFALSNIRAFDNSGKMVAIEVVD